MTLVFDAKFSSDLPQTHALVIAVSDYPHLIGGSSEPRIARFPFGLKSLSSPTLSGMAVADWLITSLRNNLAPLGTVELLLSPGVYRPGDKATQTLGVASAAEILVDEATFDYIRAATEQWYQRGHANRDNVTLFYFCGHGLEASDRYLLARDYGSSALSWSENMINFNLTHLNMRHCQAKTQLYWIDACRDQPDELVRMAATQPIGRSLLSLTGAQFNRDAPVYHAATPGRPAFGPPGKCSYFTSALIDCLNGMGSREPRGKDAPINVYSLSQALKELVSRFAIETQQDLSCSVEGVFQLNRAVDVHLADHPVSVLTLFKCTPDAAHTLARLEVTDAHGNKVNFIPYDDKPWALVVTAGRCSVTATFEADAGYHSSGWTGIVNAPLCEQEIPCEVVP